MATIAERRTLLKSLLAQDKTLIVPGAYDAVSARLVEQAGFPVVYVGSYATAASGFGLADIGLITMSEMAAYAKTIVDAVSVPVLADAENGFNNAASVWRTVQAFEQAGVAGIHIEDHEFGKHVPVPQVLLSTEQMVEKIKAALDAREDPNFLIIARTDAAWALDDLAEAVRRANAFSEVGADMVFLAGCTPEQLRTVRKDIRGKVVLVDTPGFSAQDEEDAGAAVVLYYGFCLYTAYQAVKVALTRFKETMNQEDVRDMLADVPEFETFAGFDDFVTKAKKYGLA